MLPTLIARFDLLFLIFSVLQAFKLKARTWLVYTGYLMVVSFYNRSDLVTMPSHKLFVSAFVCFGVLT